MSKINTIIYCIIFIILNLSILQLLIHMHIFLTKLFIVSILSSFFFLTKYKNIYIMLFFTIIIYIYIVYWGFLSFITLQYQNIFYLYYYFYII